MFGVPVGKEKVIEVYEALKDEYEPVIGGSGVMQLLEIPTLSKDVDINVKKEPKNAFFLDDIVFGSIRMKAYQNNVCGVKIDWLVSPELWNLNNRFSYRIDGVPATHPTFVILYKLYKTVVFITNNKTEKNDLGVMAPVLKSFADALALYYYVGFNRKLAYEFIKTTRADISLGAIEDIKEDDYLTLGFGLARYMLPDLNLDDIPDLWPWLYGDVMEVIGKVQRDFGVIIG